MDYEKLGRRLPENTKAIISVDLAGIIGNYEKLFSIAERKKALFHPANKIQERMGRIQCWQTQPMHWGQKKTENAAVRLQTSPVFPSMR